MQTTVSQAKEIAPGVFENPNGGYHIHIMLKERQASPIIGSAVNLGELAPVGSPTLAAISVFEDVVVFELEGEESLVIRVSELAAVGSVVYFYHPNGTVWRVVPLEQLNPGWVMGNYRFRADLGKFEVRLARMRSKPGTPRSRQKGVTFWQTGGWSGAVVYTATGLVYRVKGWQHSELVETEVVRTTEEQVENLKEAYPEEVQQIVALPAAGVEKETYQVGGLRLLLKYVERIGLVEAVNRYCPRVGDISDGTVITVLVLNRLLAPCALQNVAAWVADSGLHLLLGIAEAEQLNYFRLADALLAVYDHWQEIAAEVTLQAVKAFGLKVETIHYDLTSVMFQGQYQDSDWAEYGYSRDHRPDKKQLNLGVSATSDGEVVLPGGCNAYPGSTNDGTTTVPAHQQLHALFGRSDILVTGDRIMHNAANMWAIDQAQGRFLGPTDWTAELRRIVAACLEDEFQTLPYSHRAGYEIKATYRWLFLKVKEKLSADERALVAQIRRQRRLPGSTPRYNTVRFGVRAAIILDTQKQKADEERRNRRLQLYQGQLDWVRDHLNQGRHYKDPEWVTGHLADLAAQFKDVRSFVKVSFSQQEGQMSLEYQLCQDKIDLAARLDGKWVLVTNQYPLPDQSQLDYLDWMVRVYKNHRHIERRMRNLKSDLSIRPVRLRRDDAIIAYCFVVTVALMLYTLIERDCQADPTLVEAGLITTNRLLNALSGYCLTVFFPPSGYKIYWFDTASQLQQLIWKQFDLPNPGRSAPIVRQPGLGNGLPATSILIGLFGPIYAHFAPSPFCYRMGLTHCHQVRGQVALYLVHSTSSSPHPPSSGYLLGNHSLLYAIVKVLSRYVMLEMNNNSPVSHRAP